MSIGKSKLKRSVILDAKGTQYPFGVCDLSESQLEKSLKILVRKKLTYKSIKEKQTMDSKLSILKNICHRNIINIKNIEYMEEEGFYIYYNYVPLALEGAFQKIDHLTFKDLHKQVIQLAIHLAKNYILTSFSPSRCGVHFVDGKPFLKYYLPLNQITISQDISALERSVQLFKVQAMHLLDKIRHPDIFSDCRSSQDEEKFSNENLQPCRQKKRSLVIGTKERRLSSLSLKKRKYTSFNDMIKRKKSQDSTHDTQARISDLKKTLKSIRFHSQRKRTYAQSRQKIKIRVNLIKIRSAKALQIFEECKREIVDNAALAWLLKLRKRV